MLYCTVEEKPTLQMRVSSENEYGLCHKEADFDIGTILRNWNFLILETIKLFILYTEDQ